MNADLKTDLKKHLEIRASTVHGRGLFSRVNIPAGVLLGVCEVKKTSLSSAYTLCLGVDAGAVEVLCKMKYINHSRRPNVVYYDDLTVVALRAIRRGEELFHDYGADWK